jgi:hypothetical protein
MRRAAPVACVLALVGAASVADGAVTLEIGVDAKVGTDVAAHVTVRNIGDETALQLAPEAALGDATVRGEPYASLSVGFSTAWDLVLPRPAAPGAFPLVVQLRYGDTYGRSLSAPVVHEIRTAPTARRPLAVTLDVPALTTRVAGTVHVRNDDTAPIPATLRLLASGDIAVRPASQDIEVPADSTLHVPIELENRGAQPESTAALHAWVTTVAGGVHGLALAAASVPIVEPATAERRPIVGIALAAVLALGAIAALLRRRLAAPRLPQSRAARRRDRR